MPPTLVGGLSSLKLTPFTRVNLYTEPNQKGYTTAVEWPKEYPTFNTISYRDTNKNWISWNDKAQSLKVDIMADELKKCCGTGASAEDSHACGNYFNGSQECRDGVATYCTGVDAFGTTVGKHHFDDEYCQKWYNSNATENNTAIAAGYCAGAGSNTPFCENPNLSGDASFSATTIGVIFLFFAMFIFIIVYGSYYGMTRIRRPFLSINV